MKVTLFALFVGLLMVGWGEETVDFSKLQDRNGVKYHKNEETPFTGLAESFYENGEKKAEINWKDGKRDGLGTGWYENGQKRAEENYKDGKLMSVEVWKPNGEKCSVTNLKDGNGVAVWYSEDGTEVLRATYKDNEPVLDDTAPKKDSIETAVDLSKLQDRDGVKYLPNEETPFTGRACWYKNGQKRSEGNFKDGKMDGLWITWSDGRKWGKGLHKAGEVNFKDGKQHGLETHFWYPYHNGKKMWEVNYKDGKKNGTFIGWDKEGLKLVEENYKDGKKEGLWIKYKSDGTESSRQTFKNGELVED